MAHTPTFSVTIPWSDNYGRRGRIYEWVRRRWTAYFPEIPVLEGRDPFFDTGKAVEFNRSRARNDAARQVRTEFMLMADADTAFDPWAIRDGLRMLQSGKAWVIPYVKYYNLTQAYTNTLLNDTPPTDLMVNPSADHVIESWAGLLMMNTRDYWAIGGYDTRYEGWGWEDNAFRNKMNEHVGPFSRANDGRALHLWHERIGLDFDTPQELENRRLYNQEFYGVADKKVRHK